jgi:hypothetical protein
VVDAVSFFIKGVVLRLGDWYLLTSATDINKIGLLLVTVLHNKSPPSAFAEMERHQACKTRPQA